MSEYPLVSVCLITYNHEKFIRKAIDSILQQKTGYSYELIIADDFSTDSSREIILDYEKRHPSVIKLILQKKNIGAGNNFIELIRSARGKYIAYFEGDDYWIGSEKLQKQVEFLENHPEFVLVFHNVNVVTYDDKFIKKIYSDGRKNIIEFIDLVKGDYTKTCSSVFRNDIKKLSPIFEKKIPPDDTTLFLLLLEGSKAYYFEDTFAAYRIHEGGIWSSKKKDYQLQYSSKYLKQIIEYYGHYPEVKYFYQQLNTVYMQLATEYFLQRKYSDWLKFTGKCVMSLKWVNRKSYINSGKICLQSLFRKKGDLEPIK